MVNEKSEIRMAAVNVNKERALEKRFNIKAVPTFKFFIDGKMIEYNGTETAEGFLTWLKQDHQEL